MLPDEQPYGPSIQRKLLQHDNSFPIEFGVRSPVVKKNFQP